LNNELKTKAKEIRKKILNMVMKSGGAHIGPAYSIVEILTALYFKGLRIDPNNPNWEERDRFILSKGHGCAALYVVLTEKGFFPEKELDKFCKKEGILGGHPERDKIPGVEASTGSLGHGLSIGVGMALVGKFDQKNYRVFVLLGDGECQEGSVWEAAMSAAQFRLDNLIAIVDYNKLQAIGAIDEIISLKPLKEKWSSFGWSIKEIDGHNFGEILPTLKLVPFEKGKPSLIVAHTVKGKGVSFMENKIIWHFRLPNQTELKQALEELELDK
jgi:transketolase